MTESTSRPSVLAIYLPALANLSVVVALAAAARIVGFAHPLVLEIGEGRFDAFVPDTSASMAADIVGRLHWSVAHASWWVVQVILAIVLLRLFWVDTGSCGELGKRMRQLYVVGLAVVAISMLTAGLAGVQFAGPFATALQALPVGPSGPLVVVGATAVNAGAASLTFMLALGFCACVLRTRSVVQGAGEENRGVERFDQLLWAGGGFLALTTLEITLGYRWAAALVEPSAGELAAAVACAQARVIGGVSSLSLGVTAFAAWAMGCRGRVPVVHASWRVLAVFLPLLVALVGAECATG